MRRLPFLALPFLCACFTAELDPDAAGVFACDEDDPCPGDQSCVNERCEAGAPPRVDIRNPEEEEPLPIGDAPPGMRTITLILGGTLDLVDPDESSDNVFGEGHLEVSVEGAVVGTVESGALSAGVPFEITVPNELGPVRVAVQGLRNDGSRYDNPEAVDRRLFWIDDMVTPLVGIREPWPGSSFELEDEEIAVNAAVLNFSLLPADPNSTPVVATGHVHIYYDVNLEDCLADPICDDSYITTVTTAMSSAAALPDDAAGTATIYAVLRNINHTLFLFPDAAGTPIVDQIQIVRGD